jgi:hypothetical protein
MSSYVSRSFFSPLLGCVCGVSRFANRSTASLALSLLRCLLRGIPNLHALGPSLLYPPLSYDLFLWLRSPLAVGSVRLRVVSCCFLVVLLARFGWEGFWIAPLGWVSGWLGFSARCLCFFFFSVSHLLPPVLPVVDSCERYLPERSSANFVQ